MEGLLTVIVTWLSINFGIVATYDHPIVKFVPPAVISDFVYGTVSDDRREVVVSAYDDVAKVIFLADSWTGRTRAETSILVHELVHHLQNISGQQFVCPGAREEMAYEAQAQWLGLFGSDLLNEFQVDRMTLKIRTGCF